MRYWKTEEDKIVETGKLEYYGYKLQQLKDRKQHLNEEYYNHAFMKFVEKIIEEMCHE